MHESHSLRQSAARTDLSLGHLPGLDNEEGLVRETRSAPDVHIASRRHVWASKSRIGLGVGILATVSICAMGSVWLRPGGDQAQIDDGGHVVVEPMKNDLPLAPMPNPKNMGITRELAKLLPYRMHLNVNGVTKTLNFTAYRPPHKYKDHYWHFTKLDWAHHLKAEEDMTKGRRQTFTDVGRRLPTTGFDNADLFSLDVGQISFTISNRLDLAHAHRLSNITAIHAENCTAGQLVFSDPVLPILTIVRTSAPTGKGFVWPFGELWESSLFELNRLLLGADIDARNAPYIWLESIQLPSYQELQKYGDELKKHRNNN